MLGDLIDVIADPCHMTHQFGVGCVYDFLRFAFWLFDLLTQCQLAQKSGRTQFTGTGFYVVKFSISEAYLYVPISDFIGWFIIAHG